MHNCTRRLAQYIYQNICNSKDKAAAAAAAKAFQSCLTLCPQRRQPIRLLCPWDSPGKNAGVGCHFLLQKDKAIQAKSIFKY